MLKKLSYFTLKEKIGIILYSLSSRIINRIPKTLKADYEFIRKYHDKINITPSKKSILIDYKLNNISTCFDLKIRTSDSSVFEQIIINKEYEAITDIIKNKNINLRTVIDAGANIGLTSIYFARHYPMCEIIALEPNTATYARCLKNISLNNIETIELIKKGLWSRTTKLKADQSFRDGEDWSFRLVEASNNEDAQFETISVDDIIRVNKLERIDFLKIDIEGGEKEIFNTQNNLDWLKKVNIIAVEIHNELNCRMDILNTLMKHEFDLTESGELTIGVNKNFV